MQARLRVEAGNWVKVKSGRIQGGLTKFRCPFRVKRVGAFFVILENGERLNFRTVALYQKSGMSKENVDEGCSGMVFMGDDEIVRERGGMPLDDCVEQRWVDECENEYGDVGSEYGGDFVLGKRIRKLPSYLKDFVR
ncbi:hypothetical protein NDU88_006349 [Pleurodeles waltl]|uniref:Uncharacterized protein n=1 Tax=Pleurodeles waltl TaxID=8319 RepID=A0AAV7MCL8_PLEWA|nr:hypothetical protein NDU88_006349 [Pleurodeles waltl]